MANSLHDKLTQFREQAHKRREEAIAPFARSSFGQRAADVIANLVGSWRFIIIQSALLAAWIVFNAVSASRVDPYPFILLNLMLSF